MMHSVTPSRRGQPRPFELGPELEKLRTKAGLSIRDASTAAKFSTATWSALEKGYKTVSAGHRVPYTPRAENVIAAAQVVGMDPAEALRLAGLPPSKAPAIRSGGRTTGEREVLSLMAQLDPETREAFLTLLRRLATTGGKDGVGQVPELPPVGAVTVYDTTPAPQET
jgi:transcriptional regulator with XRE-family HTH domain